MCLRAEEMAVEGKEIPEIKVSGFHEEELKRRGSGVTLGRDTHI